MSILSPCTTGLDQSPSCAMVPFERIGKVLTLEVFLSSPIIISQTEASGMGLTSAVINIRIYQCGCGIDYGYTEEDNSILFGF